MYEHSELATGTLLTTRPTQRRSVHARAPEPRMSSSRLPSSCPPSARSSCRAWSRSISMPYSQLSVPSTATGAPPLTSCASKRALACPVQRPNARRQIAVTAHPHLSQRVAQRVRGVCGNHQRGVPVFNQRCGQRRGAARLAHPALAAKHKVPARSAGRCASMWPCRLPPSLVPSGHCSPPPATHLRCWPAANSSMASAHTTRPKYCSAGTPRTSKSK